MKIQMKEKVMAEKYISTAKVVDGILILSLPDAVSPVVWQMELGQSKSSALEIRNTDNGQFILTLKTPRQDVLDIATYANRDSAIKALLVTSAALEKAQGQLKNSANENNPNNYPVPALTYKSDAFSVLKKIIMWLAGIAAGIVLLGIVVMLLLSAVRVVLTANSDGASGTVSPSAATGATTGGAVSADEFLENR